MSEIVLYKGVKRLSNGCVINKATYLQLRKKYSMQRIAQDFGVSVDELIEELGIELTLPSSEPVPQEAQKFEVGQVVFCDCLMFSGRLQAKCEVESIRAYGSVTLKLLKDCPITKLKKGYLFQPHRTEIKVLDDDLEEWERGTLAAHIALYGREEDSYEGEPNE